MTTRYHPPSREDIKGQFDQCTDDEKALINASFAHFYYRTGPYNAEGKLKHQDGSWGEIRISPQQLRDLLAFLMRQDKTLDPGST